MLRGLIGKVVGDPNQREIQKLQPLVEAINALEPEVERKTEAELRALTDQFKARLAAGESLNDLLVEAFAAVREVAKRTVDMRPFDVQLIGGIVLHRGQVAEMRTGEGKTLVAAMPIYLNALLGRGAHLVTVNDYLARRDVLWMGPIYHTLGLTIGLLQSGAEQPAYLYDPDYQREPYPGLRPVPRREAYAADITYGTNNEFGFDYLRDNLALSLDRRVQRDLYYAIVDEVDNIFIDEARTPLIISGPSGEPVEEYSRFAAIARKLEPDVHYELDEKGRAVYLTEEGLAVVEQETGIENIYDEANYRYVHYMQQALKAQVLFLEGRDYIRQRKRIILIDQHTGRLMPSRRLSEGLHQAIEAKEGVPIRPRDVTSATVTIQNYFRMYEKLAGMSGTALTEAEEFYKIYSLEVLAIPTNKPVIRVDHPDVVYRSEEAKLRAVVREILECHSRGQPVLVGTTSVEMSERLSRRLDAERLQMAALAPRAAYALQEGDLEREKRDALRETLNGSLETMNSAVWRRMMRELNLNPSALVPENLTWIADYLQLAGDAEVRHTLERALREGIPHEVLNAKEHTREAAIIARAGEPGAVTIATNMAGRGVDIKLGGDLSDEVIHKAHQVLRARGLDPFSATPDQMDSAIAEVVPQYAQRREKVLQAGGLHVLGTERHEARRIDNQLRGRAGRQGEPGSSRFYLSLEDDLMRRFGRKEMLSKLMAQIGDDFPIEHGLVSKTIERAQTSVEGYNFDIRKHLLEYDDVLNRQRETIYAERLYILRADDLQHQVWRMIEGQVDEYVAKYGADPEQRRLIFGALDDVVPLLLPPPNGPFQGPLAFGAHLTAFPPFTIGYLADQLAGQPFESVRETLAGLIQQAAALYGQGLRQSVNETIEATLDKYDERLDRYRALLDEKIEDYIQLAEERGQVPEVRRLAQHLERTYPLPLTLPRDSQAMDLDELRDYWLAEVEDEYHRQTCLSLLARVQMRLPAGVALDHLRPLQMSPARLNDELRRALALAVKQARDEAGYQQLVQLAFPAAPSPVQVAGIVSAIKESSHLDFGRLDRLVGHLLGAYLGDLVERYLEALEPDQGRVRRDLERLRDAVVEGKKGGRASRLSGLLGQLNDLVHLEIEDLGEMLDLAVSHEYDKWAQRQLTDIEASMAQNPLVDTSWTAIAEHLLAATHTQKQVFDREHRRQTTWLPRLPLSLVGQIYADGLETDELRARLLASLRWAIEQREQSWGRQEFQRWGHLSLVDLDDESRDSLLCYLGGQQLGDLRDQPVEDLPADIYERLRFILALRQIENERLADLPDADALLSRLGETVESQLRGQSLSELDGDLQAQAAEQLRQAGWLDDPAARQRLVKQPIQQWDHRTRDEVAAFLGRRFIAAHQDQALDQLPAPADETVRAFLQRQRYFVDEGRIQHFLVHQRLTDLGVETQRTALERLARAQLEQLKRRKIANLDVRTRRAVMRSLQRSGLFTDQARRDEFRGHSLADLEPEVRRGLGAYLARQRLGENGLAALDGEARQHVLDALLQADLLSDPQRAADLRDRRLSELEGPTAVRIGDELVAELESDLADKTMEELPAEVRDQIHRILDEQDYFVDPDRASWYERNTLAQLGPDLLAGLEEHLGRVRLAELSEIPFGELPSEIQSSVLDLARDQRLLSGRAERLRLTQGGTLGQLSPAVQETIARHLGRQWLVQIRNLRPPSLPEDARTEVWSYLRQQGYLSDEFKEELFSYQRLDEFGAATQQTIRDNLIEALRSTLNTTPIADLPPELQSGVMARLRASELLIDPELLRRVEGTPIEALPEPLAQAIETTLGNYLLSPLTDRPLDELPAGVQEALWRYLDEVGYFVDDEKRRQIMERRLIDLDDALYDALIQDLSRYLRKEIGDTPVADLDEGLRQGLRQALESAGYFESQERQMEVLSRWLGELRREDLEALAGELGRSQLVAWAEQRLLDLPAADQEAILDHLQSQDWFVDEERRDRLWSQRLGELEPGMRDTLIGGLRQQQVERLAKKRLVDLEGELRQQAEETLRLRGLALEDSEMRPLRRTRVRALDPDVYRDLRRDLGRPALSEFGVDRFRDLDEERRAILSAYLGRRIMGRIERRILLHTISRLWVDYLTDIEDLRRGIGLEAYGQRDPLVEYKRRAFELFEELGDNIRRTVVRLLFRQPPETLPVERAS